MIISNCSNEKASFDIVSNPEFLREGNAVHDALHPDCVIIGASSEDAATRLAELYAPLDCPIVVTDVRSAEMTKYASNAFLATKISFINAIGAMCEAAGADVTEVARGMGYDRRIGSEFLKAGLGYSGSCFGKDTQCMVATAERLGYDFTLLRSIIEINRDQPKRFVDRMRAELGVLGGKTVAILGLAFEPNTDDLRDAKSLEIIAALLEEGVRVRAYDPVAMKNASMVFPEIDYCASAYDAVAGAHAAALVCEWDELVSLDLDMVKRLMISPTIFDGRNAYNPERMRQFGFSYYSIGRPTVRSLAVG